MGSSKPSKSPGKSGGSDGAIGFLILAAVAVIVGYGWWQHTGRAKWDLWWDATAVPAIDTLAGLLPAIGLTVGVLMVVSPVVWLWVSRRSHTRALEVRSFARGVECMRVGRGKTEQAPRVELRGRWARRRMRVWWPDGWSVDTGRARVERDVAAVAGRDVPGRWRRRFVEFPWPAADGVPDTRDDTDPVVERVTRVLTDTLPGFTRVTVTGVPPRELRVSYTHGPKTQGAPARARIEAAVGQALTGESWPGVWEPEADRVVFRPPVERAPFPVVPAIPFPEETDLSRLHVGSREDGEPWTMSLVGGRHTFIVGATGAGKGSIEQSLIRQLAPGVRAGLVRIIFIDPKAGAEALPVRALCERVMVGTGTNCEEIALFLEGLCGEMAQSAARLAQAGLRSHVPTVEHPFTVVIIDEIASLTKYLGTKKTQASILNSVGAITTMGRSSGWCLVAAVQDPRKEVVDVRDLFAVRIGLRLNAAKDVDMAIGDGSRARGALCDEIGKNEQGVGYVIEDTDPDPVKVRAGWVSDADIAAMVDEYRWPGGPVVLGADWLPTGAPAVPVAPVAPKRRATPSETEMSLVGNLVGRVGVIRPTVTEQVRVSGLRVGDRVRLDVGNGDVRVCDVVSVRDEGDGYVAVGWSDGSDEGELSCAEDDIVERS